MAKLDYGTHEPGKGLSYSRCQLAHLCPRKFQLEEIIGLGQEEDNLDFSYGHAIGAGVAALVQDSTLLGLTRALLVTLSNWTMPMYEEDTRKKKSLFWAVEAIRKFHAQIHSQSTILNQYELAYVQTDAGETIPAVELTFRILCPNGYVYEGHIDLILKEIGTSKYMVLENKTTSFTNLHEAMYQNSFQALGYSLILDSIAHKQNLQSSYSVLYLVYKSSAQEYEWMVFPKSRRDRIEAINDILLDIEVLELYREVGHYPKRGESCYNFFRACAYLDSCGMDTEVLKRLVPPANKSKYSELKEPHFTCSLDEIREHQIHAINL